MARPNPDLSRAVAGVRAFILDADGVLFYRGQPIDGSIEALRTLQELAIPYRVVTNFSSTHRSTLADWFARSSGMPAEPERIITAASAAAAYTKRRHEGQPLFVLASDDARREWEGQQLMSADEANADGARVAAVVVGDGGDALSFRNLDIAFRLARAGAELVAMHRNPWWVTERGPTLDSGAVIVGLEFALGRPATVAGKPSPVVFRQAMAELRDDLRGDPRHADEAVLTLPQVAMVGDDPRADVAPARRLRMKGILVLSGKVGSGVSEAGAAGVDATAVNLAEVVASLPPQ